MYFDGIIFIFMAFYCHQFCAILNIDLINSIQREREREKETTTETETEVS